MLRRRQLLETAALGSALAGLRWPVAHAVDTPPSVDPYFLHSGELDAQSQRDVEDVVAWQERATRGESDIKPRAAGQLAPTYRLVRWSGDLGQPGTLEGALSVTPALPQAAGYQLNAQILGLHASSDDWRGRRNRGTLTIECRTRLHGEPVTWLFAQPFDVGDDGRTTMGLEHLGQRDGARDPLVSDNATLDLRIQLIRHRKRKGLLRQILQVAAYVIGLPVAGLTGGAATLAQTLPIVRVPRLLREAVAFSQALFGGLSDEAPIWRSGFTSYAIAPGNGRLALTPGLWVAIDDSREVDLRNVQLAELGGSLALVRDGMRLDANHLVLDLTFAPARLSGSGRVIATPEDEEFSRRPSGIQPRDDGEPQ